MSEAERETGDLSHHRPVWLILSCIKRGRYFHSQTASPNARTISYNLFNLEK